MTQRIKPAGKSINATPWWHHALNIIVALLLAALGAVFLIEWAAGCGETYTDAQGVEHRNECVFLELKE